MQGHGISESPVLKNYKAGSQHGSPCNLYPMCALSTSILVLWMRSKGIKERSALSPRAVAWLPACNGQEI